MKHEKVRIKEANNSHNVQTSMRERVEAVERTFNIPECNPSTQCNWDHLQANLKVKRCRQKCYLATLGLKGPGRARKFQKHLQVVHYQVFHHMVRAFLTLIAREDIMYQLCLLQMTFH